MQTSTPRGTSSGLDWPVRQRKLPEKKLAASAVREVTPPIATLLSSRLAGAAAALCGVIAVIHLEDQQCWSFAASPVYLQAGFLLLEVGCLVAAVGLLLRPARALWLLALACGAVPFLGYVLPAAPACPRRPTTSATGDSRWEWSRSSSRLCSWPSP
jgi:hypothetical protein